MNKSAGYSRYAHVDDVDVMNGKGTTVTTDEKSSVVRGKVHVHNIRRDVQSRRTSSSASWTSFSPDKNERISRRKPRTLPVAVFLPVMFLSIVACFSLATVLILWNLPTDSPCRDRTHEIINDFNVSLPADRIVTSFFPAKRSPFQTSTKEDEERRILEASRDELNRFPISIHEFESDWETILHPGIEALKFLRGQDSDQFLRVPKFWDPEPFRTIADRRGSSSPVSSGVRRYLGDGGSRLMTPQEARAIGSRVPSGDGTILETIFVAVASYRDWQCSATVEAIFSRASHPERIRVAVVDQIHSGEDDPCSVPPKGSCQEEPGQASCRWKRHVDFFTVDAKLSVGPVFARHLGERPFSSSFSFLETDSHRGFPFTLSRTQALSRRILRHAGGRARRLRPRMGRRNRPTMAFGKQRNGGAHHLSLRGQGTPRRRRG